MDEKPLPFSYNRPPCQCSLLEGKEINMDASPLNILSSASQVPQPGRFRCPHQQQLGADGQSRHSHSLPTGGPTCQDSLLEGSLPLVGGSLPLLLDKQSTFLSLASQFGQSRHSHSLSAGGPTRQDSLLLRAACHCLTSKAALSHLFLFCATGLLQPSIIRDRQRKA